MTGRGPLKDPTIGEKRQTGRIIGEKRQTGRIIGREPLTIGTATKGRGLQKGETIGDQDRITTEEDRWNVGQITTEDPPRDQGRPKIRLEGVMTIGTEGGHQTGKIEGTRTGAGPGKEVMASTTLSQAITVRTITTPVE